METIKGHTTAQVSAAFTLSESQVSMLEDTLAKKTGKKVSVTERTDTSLIGGLYISVEGYVIDGTVKKQLRDMMESLKRGGADDIQYG